MACLSVSSCFPPMGSSFAIISQHQILRSQIAWSKPQRSCCTLQALANNHIHAASADTSTQWQRLDRPLLWQGSETAALQANALPSTLTPPWKVILLSDGSVTRHLQLMTGLPVSVECLEMRRLEEHEILLSNHEATGYNSDGNGISINNNLPPAISLLEGPLLQRQVLLHLPEPLNRAFVYAASWWNADTVEEYLKDKDQPIWVSLSRERTEMYREIIDLEYGHSPELEEKFGAKGPFWGRSYLFWHKGRPLTLIYEVFSSELEEFLDTGDVQTLREQLEMQAREIQRLQGTTSHYRAWAAQLQARYQMFSPDAARPAKRVYIGNLPPEMNEELVDTDLRMAINDLMAQIGGVMGEGPAVASCKLYPAATAAPSRTYYRQISNSTDHSSRSISPDRSGNAETSTTAAANASPAGVMDKSYAFVEFRSVEEASNCMALDGVRFKDTFLKIRRPNNYDPAVAIMLGPIEPSPALDLSGLDIVRTVVQDSPHKVFIGGLPCDWTEEQVTEMLVPFGTLKAFNLVMDRATGNSRGYAFCEFNDVSITDNVITALHGKPVGNKYLTVKRALGPTPY